MGKVTGRGRSRDSSAPTLPRLKLFRPISWYGGRIKSLSDYIEHLLTELGRLGLGIHEIERHDRPPNTQTVLSDLMSWLCTLSGEAYAKLVDWRALDLSVLHTRLERDRSTKPRIELSAHITKMNNLSVRWHPKGWRESTLDWHRTDHNHFNLITHRKWVEPPDFQWFEGDEDPTFDSRPSNELMYIRGVGNLRPEPIDSYGPYATFNRDVLDSILISAVRAAYETLIDQLEQNFDVNVLDAFEFVVRDENHGDDELSRRFLTHRVVGWSLEDAAELKARQAQKAREQQEQRDREEFAELPRLHNFTIASFVDALLIASSKKRTGPAPSNETINRNTGKALGVGAATVRRMRELLERYAPHDLPALLRPESAPTTNATARSNVVRLQPDKA